jgi:hypothetical protein
MWRFLQNCTCLARLPESAPHNAQRHRNLMWSAQTQLAELGNLVTARQYIGSKEVSSLAATSGL